MSAYAVVRAWRRGRRRRPGRAPDPDPPMLVAVWVLLATAAAAAAPSPPAACYRRGWVNFTQCSPPSKQPWWTVYTEQAGGQWERHAGVNCVRPKVPGPDPFSSSISLEGCHAACSSDAQCHAIVVPTPGVPNPRPPSPPRPPGPPLPGLSDVCAHMSAAETCSPEICELQPRTTVQLEARTYYQNTSIVLPEGVQLIGAGINKTVIVACGAPSSGRRGFILGNHSYLGHYTWQGLQAHRGNFDAAFGTPGCLQHDEPGPMSCYGTNGTPACIPPDGDCAGVMNATVEHVHVRPYSNGTDRWPLSTSAGWFPHTLPWLDPATGRRHTGSLNITVRGVINWGT